MAASGLLRVTSPTKEEKLFILAEKNVIASLLIDLRKVRSHEMSVMLERGAHISLFVLSGSRQKCHLKQFCSVASGARIQWWNFTLGGNVEQNLDIAVNGASARADVRWISRAKKKDTQNLVTHVTYVAPKGSGETLMRGVVEDHAVVRSHGSIDVGRKAHGTETFLSDQILVLDPTAKATAVPELKVETNDVKAGHNAAVSRINPEDLFYLQSRGLSPTEARSMSIKGFIANLLQEIDCEEVRELVVGGNR